MRTLPRLIIAALLAGTCVLHAQEVATPAPETRPAPEEFDQVTSPEVVMPPATSASADEPSAEILGPPAPPAEEVGSTGTDGNGKFRFDFHTPKGAYSGDSVTYDPGKFVYEYRSSRGDKTMGFKGSFIEGFWFSPVMTMIRSGLLVLWIALGCATAAIFQPAIARTQVELRQTPGRSAALGFLWLISFWILLLAGVVMALVLIGLPFILVVLVFDLALRVFGLTVTFAVVGEWVARRLNRPGVSIYAAVFIGACVLGLFRLVPIAGSFIWFAAALFGVGATLATRFGSATTPPALGYTSGPAPMTPVAA